jgi:hypothetical protein
MGVFNTFTFFSTSDTSQCGEPTENGGGGAGSCAPNGCEIVYNDQLELPALASQSIICEENFNGQKLRRSNGRKAALRI